MTLPDGSDLKNHTWEFASQNVYRDLRLEMYPLRADTLDAYNDGDQTWYRLPAFRTREPYGPRAEDHFRVVVRILGSRSAP